MGETAQRYEIVKDLKEFTVNPNKAELLVLFNSDAVMAAKECESRNLLENYVFERLKKMDKMPYLFAGWKMKK